MMIVNDVYSLFQTDTDRSHDGMLADAQRTTDHRPQLGLVAAPVARGFVRLIAEMVAGNAVQPGELRQDFRSFIVLKAAVVVGLLRIVVVESASIEVVLPMWIRTDVQRFALNRSVEALRSFRSNKPQDGQQRTEDKTEAHELAWLSPQGLDSCSE